MPWLALRRGRLEPYVTVAGPVFVAIPWEFTIRRIGPDGVLSTVAGTGSKFGETARRMPRSSTAATTSLTLTPYFRRTVDVIRWFTEVTPLPKQGEPAGPLHVEAAKVLPEASVQPT